MILVLLVLSVFLVLSSSPAFGQATDSATPELVQENIKKRIEKVVEEKTTSQKRAWVGTLTDIANQTLTLKNRLGSRQVAFTADTAFVETPGNKTITGSDLALDSQIIAMGFINGSGVLTARRIVVITKPTTSASRVIYFGTVTQYQASKKLLILTPLQGDSATITLTKNTIITSGKTQTKANSQDIKPDSQVLIIAQADSQENLTALRVHLL